MNPFETHDINHFSASSINLFRASPALWIMRYLEKVTEAPNLNMLRGSCGEDGVTVGLMHPDMPVEDAIDVATNSLHKQTHGGPISGEKFEHDLVEKAEKELAGYETSRTKYPGAVRNAVETLRTYGVPSKVQERIEIRMDGIDVPVIGWKDYSYDAHGVDVDLKMPNRLPSIMAADHRLQGAIYWKASGNRTQRFCYATPKEAQILELDVESANAAWRSAEGIAHTIKRFLSLSTDKRELAGLVVPDYAGFRWSDALIAKGQEIFGY